jgi:hypothetical protein
MMSHRSGYNRINVTLWRLATCPANPTGFVGHSRVRAAGSSHSGPLVKFPVGTPFTAALAGIVVRYWTRETVPQIIQTVALMWLFLLVMDLIRFWRWRQTDAASGSAGRVR